MSSSWRTRSTAPENSESTLPTPDEIIKLLGGVTEAASSNVGV